MKRHGAWQFVQFVPCARRPRQARNRSPRVPFLCGSGLRTAHLLRGTEIGEVSAFNLDLDIARLTAGGQNASSISVRPLHMAEIPTGALLMFAVAGAVAACSYSLVRSCLLATALAVAFGPLVFVLVCWLFGQPPQRVSANDFVVLGAMSVPPTLVVGVLFKIAKHLFSRPTKQ